MGAACVRPKPGSVILVKRALLKKDTSLVHHEDTHGLVLEAAFVNIKLFDRLKCAVDPCGNENRIGHLHDLRRFGVYLKPL